MTAPTRPSRDYIRPVAWIAIIAGCLTFWGWVGRLIFGAIG